MPNWSSGIFCGKDHAFYKFIIESLECPMDGCDFKVSGKRKDPIGRMHDHFAAEKPHNKIGQLYCYACGDNLGNSGLLSNHCQEHVKQNQLLNVPQDGTFAMFDGKVVQPNKVQAPKAAAPKPKLFKCVVCPHEKPMQGEITKHFHETHRTGLVTCPFDDCKKDGKKNTFNNLYTAATHFNNHHTVRMLLKKGRVRRRC